MDYVGVAQLDGRIVSDTPGRLRIRIRPEHRDSCSALRVQAKLQAQSGIGPVELNVLTGSLLVWYEPDKCSVEQVLDTCLRSGLATQPGEPNNAAPRYQPAPPPIKQILAHPAGRHPKNEGRGKQVFRVIVGGVRLARAIHIGLEVAQTPGPGLFWHALELLF
jgi:hypothetical protein